MEDVLKMQDKGENEIQLVFLKKVKLREHGEIEIMLTNNKRYLGFNNKWTSIPDHWDNKDSKPKVSSV